MGWCHEFGPQIQEGCGHPMVAGEASCACPQCGVVCTGRFGGCPEVWKRGPVEVALPSRAATATLEAGGDPWSRLVLEAADEAAAAADNPGESVYAGGELHQDFGVDENYGEVDWRPSEDSYRPLLSSIDVDSVSEDSIGAWLGAQTSAWEPPAETVSWPSVFEPADGDDSTNGHTEGVLWEPGPLAPPVPPVDDDSVGEPTAWYVPDDAIVDEAPAPLAAFVPPPPAIDRGERLRDSLPALPPLPEEGAERDVVTELPPIEALVTLGGKLEALQLDLKLLSVRLSEGTGGDAGAVESVS